MEIASTFPQMFARVVAERRTRSAIVMADAEVSYEELDRRTAAMARALLAVGAGKGTRIGLLAPDGIFWMTALLAGLRIGALVSVVSTLCTPPELAHILRNSDVQFFIGARRFLNHDYGSTLAAALPGLAESRAGVLRIAEAPFLRSIWLDDAAGLDFALPIEDLLARAEAPDAPDAALLRAIEQQVAPSDDGVIIYTSGSTALPKAVVHNQATLVRYPAELARFFLLKPDDRMMPMLPSFWVGGMGMVFQVLGVGATLVYPSSPDMEVALDTIEALGVDRVNSFGDLLIKLREKAVARGIDVDRIVGLGIFSEADGTHIPKELQANMLGMSESFTAHSAERLDCRMPADKAGASGRAVGGSERRVVDPDTGAEVEPGQVGELQIRGGGLMTGFYKVERAKVFTPDGFYPTNDLVRMDADGYLYFVGRQGDMIKTKAANVSRLEVEAALVALPEVELPIVVGLPDAELGEMVAAAIVPRPGAALTEDGIRKALQGVLSSFKIPRRIVFIGEEEVRRTRTGKIMPSAMAELIAARLGELADAAGMAGKS